MTSGRYGSKGWADDEGRTKPGDACVLQEGQHRRMGTEYFSAGQNVPAALFDKREAILRWRNEINGK